MVSRKSILFLLLALLLLFAIPASAAKDEWLPISKEDLAMKDYAKAPGAHAILLYYSVERNDRDGKEYSYYRIKILSEEGKKFANIETEPYTVSTMSLDNIKARVIKPDGTIVPFTGKIYDKLVVKYRSLKLSAKTFSLPDVQVGSIIEYRMTAFWDPMWVYNSRWLVQQKMYLREGHFRLVPPTTLAVAWTGFFLGADEQPKKEEKERAIVLDLKDMPPYEEEQYSPPEDEVRARVSFFYSETAFEANNDDYWKKQAKNWYTWAEDFMNKRKQMEQEVAKIVAPNDTPDVKLAKLYDRVQQLRNLTYERSKTEKEEQREKLKDNNNVDDVLKHGFGYHNQLNRTFTALARAAGFDAQLVRIAERDSSFFHKQNLNPSQLSTELAVIKLNGKEEYLDPGVPFCPYGMLSWEDTGVHGVLLKKDDLVWTKTPLPDSEYDTEKRVAELNLSEDGTLSGDIHVFYIGQAGLKRRLSAREDDETERKKDLENTLKAWLPMGATLELQRVGDWNSAKAPLDSHWKVTITNYATSTGKRMMVPFSVFAGADRHPFTHNKRANPVYFRSPYREIEEVKLTVPDNFKIENLPKIAPVTEPFATFTASISAEKNVLTFKRQVDMKDNYFAEGYYPALRSFFDKVKASGEEQVVIRVAGE